MGPVLEVLKSLLKHHEPLPALVVDRFWNVKMRNRAAGLLLNIGGNTEEVLEKLGSTGEINLALLTLHPLGLRRYISNWDQVAPLFIRRLKREAMTSGDPKIKNIFSEYIKIAGPVDDSGLVAESLLPVLPVKINIGELKLSLFSIISTIGTPQDITTDELRIESFYPTDETTEEFFEDFSRQARSTS